MKKNALYSVIALIASALTLQPVSAQPARPSAPTQPTAPIQPGLPQPSSPSNSQLIDATDPNKILEIARSYGDVELKKDSDGDPLIIGTMDGMKYAILFYGCKSGKDCDDIQFAAAWSTKIPMDKINTWNRTKRYGRAYIDSDGDPGLKMIVNIDYGVSKENLKDTFNWWKRILTDFNREVIGQ
jgi:Putative bacterial sensory transduction regulator